MYPVRQGKTPKQAHVDIPEGLHEEEHGRKGFAGPSSHLYRSHPPTGWSRIEGPCRPRAFACGDLATPDSLSPDAGPVEIVRSLDVSLLISRRSQTMPYFFRNADGDELHFIHEGRGLFETDYGGLRYEPGHYVLIPKGTTYRIVVEKGPCFSLIIVSPEPFSIPDRGLLGHHALFDQGVLAVPEPALCRADEREWEVRIQRDGTVTRVFYPFSPVEVVGWKGDLWPTTLHVRDFRPVTSPRYHLPPSVHTTFQTSGVVISTFAPRPLESDPAALKVPFYHRNMDYDEVLFYHAGSFFSRGGIQIGTLTVHPQGIHHGPHPSAVEASKEKTETQEIAVMVESRRPFRVLSEAEAVELKDYAMSWRVP